MSTGYEIVEDTRTVPAPADGGEVAFTLVAPTGKKWIGHVQFAAGQPAGSGDGGVIGGAGDELTVTKLVGFYGDPAQDVELTTSAVAIDA